jgi:hypothetical protein
MAWILVTITGGELFEPDKSDSPRIRVVCCETGEENEAKTSALYFIRVHPRDTLGMNSLQDVVTKDWTLQRRLE